MDSGTHDINPVAAQNGAPGMNKVVDAARLAGGLLSCVRRLNLKPESAAFGLTPIQSVLPGHLA